MNKIYLDRPFLLMPESIRLKVLKLGETEETHTYIRSVPEGTVLTADTKRNGVTLLTETRFSLKASLVDAREGIVKVDITETFIKDIRGDSPSSINHRDFQYRIEDPESLERLEDMIATLIVSFHNYYLN